MKNIKCKTIKEFVGKNILYISLALVLILLFLYLFSDCFRAYLIQNNIDPNFIIGFFTVITLILSIIQSLSDRRFSYNISLVSSIEEKGLSVIAKLLTIRQKSEVLFKTILLVKSNLDKKLIFKDLNEVLSKHDLEKDLEMATAYVQTYFPEEGKNWNEIQDDLSKLATNCGNVLINYEENIENIKSNIKFKSQTLDNIDNILSESNVLYHKIDKSAEDMYERIVIKLNSFKGNLKNGFKL